MARYTDNGENLDFCLFENLELPAAGDSAYGEPELPTDPASVPTCS